MALDLSTYLKIEKEYVPWNAVLAELNYIDSMLHNEREYSDWIVLYATAYAAYLCCQYTT